MLCVFARDQAAKMEHDKLDSVISLHKIVGSTSMAGGMYKLLFSDLGQNASVERALYAFEVPALRLYILSFEPYSIMTISQLPYPDYGFISVFIVTFKQCSLIKYTRMKL